MEFPSSLGFFSFFLSPPSLQIYYCYFFWHSISLNLGQDVHGTRKMVMSVCDPGAAKRGAVRIKTEVMTAAFKKEQT